MIPSEQLTEGLSTQERFTSDTGKVKLIELYQYNPHVDTLIPV